MNPRSLVGMSMGARKRAARRWLWPDDNRRDALKMFCEMVAESPRTRYEHGLARMPYLIGQKLRPCLRCAAWTSIIGSTGCMGCGGRGVLLAKKNPLRGSKCGLCDEYSSTVSCLTCKVLENDLVKR